MTLKQEKVDKEITRILLQKNNARNCVNAKNKVE